MEKINIVLTSSEYYIPYTYVLMQSILENTNRTLKFYILTTDITEISQEKFNILKQIRDFDIEFIYVDLNNYPIPKQARANSIVYAKMNIPKFIPELKKCLVFDSDIIVQTDIGKIYDINLEENYVAWVADPIDVTLRPSWVDKFSISKEKQYINSGVLVFNLELYKNDNIESKLLENYQKFKKDIVFFDQDLLYITLNKKSIYLDYKYNYLCQLKYDKPGLKEQLRQNALIIHYGTDKKPWVYPDSEKAEIWWDYARRTPYYEIILQRMLKVNPNLEPVRKLTAELKDAFKYRQNVLKYWRYKLMAKIMFGQKKEHYIKKKQIWKNKIRIGKQLRGEK